MALFRRNKRESSSPVMRLPFVQYQFAAGAQLLESKTIEPALECAKLADCFRDADLQPIAPAEFDSMTDDLDEHGWRRLALQVCGFDDEAAHASLPALATATGSVANVVRIIVEHAIEKSAHTMELLCQSRLRTEEFARSFGFRLGLSIDGESPAESAATLERLDYGRLLAEAEAAKGSAEERMAYLNELQEEAEREHYRRRRGKW